ncbi:class I SAM-dependent methyltransferase [Nocardia xishanensis]|uniref:class I SAM-dependent methyltransferase n=1 Tax=Nocardia xishanensis TaxID=238964 RepID=UPI0008324E3F|nr:class I SAM-dependent methyltransferase [Nocardia xishanensis]
MSGDTVRDFYDHLAGDYHLLYQDWPAAVAGQGRALDRVLRGSLGAGPSTVLDAACGIGTQAIGLAACGHSVVGMDSSPVAAVRAAEEARTRGLRLPTLAGDMRALPFDGGWADAVVCADNALPHLLTAVEVDTALGEMWRVLRPGGLLVLTTRDYDALRAAKPAGQPPKSVDSAMGRAITFQLWHWDDDGERYDFEMFRLTEGGDGWAVRVGAARYWALTRAQLTEFVIEAGFTQPAWHSPEETGFFQPVLTAHRSGPA